MKSFNQYILLTEATDFSTSFETVLGVCYQAAKVTGGKENQRKVLRSLMNKGAYKSKFTKTKTSWKTNKGKKVSDIDADNLLSFGNKIVAEVEGDGSFAFQGKGQITDQWATWANKKGKDTSKTDIILGKKQYSVKNASGAQLMSGKKGESIATASAAADMTNMTDAVRDKITAAMDELQEVTTEGYYASIEHLNILKKQTDQQTGGYPAGTKIIDYAQAEKKKYDDLYTPWKKAKEKYKKDLAAWTLKGKGDKPKRDYGAEPKKPPQSILDIADNPDLAKTAPTTINDHNAQILDDMENDFKDNSVEVEKLLNEAFKSTPGYKIAFVFEAATGRYKFGNQIQQAKYMLSWKPVSSGIQDFVVNAYPVSNTNSKIIKDYASKIGLDVNWKSASIGGHKGYNAYQNVRLGLKATLERGEELQTMQYDEFDEYSQLLNEGVIDEGAFWDKVKEIGKKFIDKSKELWNKFLNFFTEAVEKIIDAAKDGIRALGNIMGFDMEVNDTLRNQTIRI